MSDYSELKRLARRVIEIEALGGTEPIGNAWDELEAVATPDAVLALIAENERMAAELECPIRLARHSRQLVEKLKAENAGLRTGYKAYEQVNAELRAEVEALTMLLDTPHTDDWFEGVRLEAGHQIKRFGAEHDAGKSPADWFWLVGYLAQKAMNAQMSGDEYKAKHHTISTGAAMLNWFRAITGESNDMRPGISSPESHL